ncbi:Histidine phosphatase superfamily, clade-2 [Dillenia turbinata]|uniref:Multiple inositol polyphosphate phosphatase 1 n=1 Tax=Dillenia turbinata TaxID=194707 RepID=A0AAN8ZAH9_9MAGN
MPNRMQSEKKLVNMAMAALLLFFTLFIRSIAFPDFDVRQHLATVTRYDVVKDVPGNSFIPSNIPDQCTPIHLNLVARHGTRAPTKKRIKELNKLASSLEVLLRERRSASEHDTSLQNIPAWMDGWKSPWEGKVKGGELVSQGEKELYNLGIRIRERFPDLFADEYHPDVYAIKATQVPRASASAVAFGMGLFSGRGTLGEERNQAFAVATESRASDMLLRFFDSCQTYNDFRKSKEPDVEKLKEPVLDEITAALVKRYRLNFTRQHTASLWFLCKQEASLLNITNQACDLFSPSEVTTLEWTDDLEGFLLKGYGKSINYEMGVPLLKDVLQSMEQAIKAKEEKQAPGTYEKARLRLAHAETLVPFSCLLGLFLNGSEFELIQREQPLPLPPMPPQKRSWRGSFISPFAGNNMLVLYSCPAKNSSNYFVQVLHNEHPTPMPGCGNSDLCSFEDFKEKIVVPHLKHDYHTVCNANLEVPVEQLETKQKPSKLSQLFSWLFSRKNEKKGAEKDEL